VLLIGGFGLILAAILRPSPVASQASANLAFTGLLVLLAVVAAVAPYREDALATVLTLLAAVLFVVMEASAHLRRARLWVVLALVLAGQASVLVHLPFPKQDAFRMLTYAVDGLFRHGIEPYARIPDPVSPDVRPYDFAYPPGVLLLFAPFRLLLGDVRWGFIVAEAVFVVAGARAAGRGPLATWRQAILLVPLVFPRADQAFFDYGNYDWMMLALVAVVVASRRRPLVCGLVLGLGIVSKQYFVVFPVLFLLPWLTAATLVGAGLTAVVIAAPFLAWDPRGFTRGVGAQLTTFMDPDRLTVYGMLRAARLDPGPGAALALSGLGLAAGVGCVSLRSKRLHRAVVLSGVGFALFTLLAKTAAYNYYAYALGLVALGWSLSVLDEGDQARGRRHVLDVPGELGREDGLLHPGAE
jgi:hypothetical protein